VKVKGKKNQESDRVWWEEGEEEEKGGDTVKYKMIITTSIFLFHNKNRNK